MVCSALFLQCALYTLRAFKMYSREASFVITPTSLVDIVNRYFCISSNIRQILLKQFHLITFI